MKKLILSALIVIFAACPIFAANMQPGVPSTNYTQSSRPNYQPTLRDVNNYYAQQGVYFDWQPMRVPTKKEREAAAREQAKIEAKARASAQRAKAREKAQAIENAKAKKREKEAAEQNTVESGKNQVIIK